MIRVLVGFFAIVLLIFLVFRPSLGLVSLPRGEISQDELTIERPWYPVARELNPNIFSGGSSNLFTPDPHSSFSPTIEFEFLTGEGEVMIGKARVFYINPIFESFGETVFAVSGGGAQKEFEVDIDVVKGSMALDRLTPLGFSDLEAFFYFPRFRAELTGDGVIIAVKNDFEDIRILLESSSFEWNQAKQELQKATIDFDAVCASRTKSAYRMLSDFFDESC